MGECTIIYRYDSSSRHVFNEVITPINFEEKFISAAQGTCNSFIRQKNVVVIFLLYTICIHLLNIIINSVFVGSPKYEFTVLFSMVLY